MVVVETTVVFVVEVLVLVDIPEVTVFVIVDVWKTIDATYVVRLVVVDVALITTVCPWVTSEVCVTGPASLLQAELRILGANVARADGVLRVEDCAWRTTCRLFAASLVVATTRE